MRIRFNGHSITIGWKTVSAIVLTVAGFGTAMTAGADLWHRIGWQTPQSHDADVTAIRDMLKAFRDEWKCSELASELDELLRQQDGGDSSAVTGQRVRELREQMGPNGLNCQRFED